MRQIAVAVLLAGAMIAVAILAAGCATTPEQAASVPVEPIEIDIETGRALICISLPHGQAPDYCEN